MLILNESDIVSAINFTDLLKSTEEAMTLQEQGDYFMPDRIHLSYQGNVQLLMPAFTKKHFATKLVSVFPGNVKNNKPALFGTVILNDGHTGEPLAVLNGAKLTALRTAAVGALGLLYTTPRELNSLGLIGAGVQGFHQVLLACTVRQIKYLGINDPHHPALDTFIQQLSQYLPELEIKVYHNVNDLLQNSQAIITATTSLTPVLPADMDLLSGKHFIGIGSYTPDMQEYPEELFSQLDQVFIDTPLACKEAGDLSIPLKKGILKGDQVHTLGKLIVGDLKIDFSQTTLFKSVGMALFDLLVAQAIYKNALNKGIGQEVNF